MEAIVGIGILIFIIITLITVAIMQINMAGIEVKDFWSFIKANEELDKLYLFSKKYNKMSPQEKIIFLQETEKMSDAFEKIPSIIWEDEYSKYRDVMDTYRDIKVDRWKDSSTK
ncbi:MAG: hypothetical protein BHW09_07745 [Clostridium sp. CAG:245_30_32]|jgi:hypothetical protein|nr:MAG: hypothetical protein BHW09_07745 [Clostridium sp. CAG:245_30_32]